MRFHEGDTLGHGARGHGPCATFDVLRQVPLRALAVHRKRGVSPAARGLGRIRPWEAQRRDPQLRRQPWQLLGFLRLLFCLLPRRVRGSYVSPRGPCRCAGRGPGAPRGPRGLLALEYRRGTAQPFGAAAPAPRRHRFAQWRSRAAPWPPLFAMDASRLPAGVPLPARNGHNEPADAGRVARAVRRRPPSFGGGEVAARGSRGHRT
mmetsp:Transcript_5190/g.12893  ORF Transcript_5190/g.12893 Transcript_5190/m.12893 type:complete len:206 (+) Transcript_5190:28-645(+)